MAVTRARDRVRSASNADRTPLLALRARTPIAIILALLSIAAEPKKGPDVHELPAQSPVWLDGYRLRWPLAVVGDPAKQKNETIIARIPTGGWLKRDAADLAVQSASGETLPLQVLSHDPAGDTIIQFKRRGNDVWYWAYGMSDKPLPQAKLDPAAREGMIAEFRDWAGDDLASWMKVRDGLKKSENVIGNALAAEVLQNCNPARPDRPQKFAASYRGFLDIKKDGVYRFYVNADDAVFLFIDGFKVFERPGGNQYIYQLKQKVLQEKCGQIELKAGLHPIEVHHVVGSNVNAQGICSLLWQREGEPVFKFVPASAFAQAMLAQPAAIERAGAAAVASFACGIDDSLSSGDIRLCLVRFEAQGDIKDEKTLVWDFGDGAKATGRSVTHVYLKDGDYPVTLQAAADLPPFRRTVTVWPAPGTTSPLSLDTAIKALAAEQWQKWPPERLRQLYAFLTVCEQNQRERWALLDAVTAHLLTQPDLEVEERTELTTARMEALANLGKPREALKLGEQAEKSVSKGSGLQLGVRLAIANIHQYHTRDVAQASAMYKRMLDDFKRVDHPNLRRAAIRWGDMLAEAGDLVEAAKVYRQANTLGGERFEKTAQISAIERGAELRKVDKVLKDGNIHQARVILGQIEVNFPEQKLEGLYRFLRAEADRYGGHYEESIRNYEILTRLQQWAGYRSRALAGIADSYNRMGKLDRALEWYDRLKDADADYYDKAKLAERRRLVEARQARIKEAESKGDKAGLFFAGYRARFEPKEMASWPELTNLSVTRGLGLDGRYVARFAQSSLANPANSFRFLRPVRHLNPDGWYWVEMWYRETLGTYNHGNQQQAYAWIAPEGDKELHIPKGAPIYIERTHGQWRKLGFKFKAPAAHDGTLVVWLLNPSGVLEIDGLSIRPVSDPQNDSLISFLEGGTEAP
jgi:tetratricopeptide (TPR) repeat protein